MSAIDEILDDHEKIRKMLSEIKQNMHKINKEDLSFKEFMDFLLRHEKMEEELLYSHLKDKKSFKKLVDHLAKEEHKASHALNELNKITDKASWKKGMLKLCNDVEHHAKEEETELFPKVIKFVDDQKLLSIGNQMQDFKKRAKKSRISI